MISMVMQLVTTTDDIQTVTDICPPSFCLLLINWKLSVKQIYLGLTPHVHTQAYAHSGKFRCAKFALASKFQC